MNEYLLERNYHKPKEPEVLPMARSIVAVTMSTQKKNHAKCYIKLRKLFCTSECILLERKMSSLLPTFPHV